MAEKEKAVKTVEKEKMVKIRLPRNRKDEEDVFVSVNDRTFQIKRGIEVEVPKCVAHVLYLQERSLEEKYEFEDSVHN